jgi:OmpA-OmpF porin, OOP family
VGADFADGAGGVGMGDLRIVPKARLPQSLGPVELAATLPLIIPTGGAREFLGQRGIGVQPRLIADATLGMVRAVATAGFNFRGEERLRNLRVGTELAYGLAAEVTFLPKWTAQGTLAGAIGLFEADEEERPLEALVAVRHQLTDKIAVSGGAGLGLTRGYGTPDFRILLGATFTPGPAPKELPKPAPALVQGPSRPRCGSSETRSKELRTCTSPPAMTCFCRIRTPC